VKKERQRDQTKAQRFTTTKDQICETERDEDNGAVVRFSGVVRGLEDGHPIRGIRYSHYETMIEVESARILSEAEATFGDHQTMICHRVGFVPKGEAAIVIEVGTPHSAKAFEICAWYLARIKKGIPIWKEVVFESDELVEAPI